MSNEKLDVEAVLAVRKRWAKASVGLNIDEMRQCFVKGRQLDMWNRNGHAYYSVDELAQLWRHLSEFLDLTEFRDIELPHVTVVGDVAWITCAHSLMDLAPRDGSPVRHYDMRCTEVLRRDDGEGKPEWRIWHCHYSVRAPEGERRPGF